MQYFNSVECFFQHFHSHPVDPHFIIVSNPINLEYVLRLIDPRVRRLFIHCSNDRLAEYDTWRDRHPELISVMQYLETLSRLIIWELSACIVDIGNYYAEEDRTDLAQTRYRYAQRLHHVIEGLLNNRME